MQQLPQLLPPAERTLNLHRCHGSTHTLSAILMRARTLPMLGQRQLILVRQAQLLKALSTSAGKKQLLDYLSAPAPHTVLAFAYHGKPLARNTTLYKALAQQASLLHSRPPYPNEVPAWAIAQARRLGYTLTEGAAVMLHTLLGEDLTLLASQLKKLCSVHRSTAPLTQAQVAQHIGLHRSFNSFELQQALATRQAATALRIAAHMAQHPKQHPLLPIVSLLTTFFSKLLQLHALQRSGPHTTAQLSTQLQAHPYALQQYQRALPHYSQQQLIAALHQLHHTDRQAKGIHHPATSEGALLKQLVAALLLGEKPNGQAAAG